MEVGAKTIVFKGRKKKEIYEKDITLRLSKILKRKLSKKYRVYLTRDRDVEVSLQNRAKIADTVNADLFISVHFNSSSHRDAEGIETYYLDNHNNVAVRKVEANENKSFDVDDATVNKILIDLAIQLTSKTSKELSRVIHQKTVGKVKRKHAIKDRGYKAGLLYVLALSKRPGVLLEAGFMSNPKELRKILHTNYLSDYAEGVVDGINNYFASKNLKKPR